MMQNLLQWVQRHDKGAASSRAQDLGTPASQLLHPSLEHPEVPLPQAKQHSCCFLHCMVEAAAGLSVYPGHTKPADSSAAECLIHMILGSLTCNMLHVTYQVPYFKAIPGVS